MLTGISVSAEQRREIQESFERIKKDDRFQEMSKFAGAIVDLRYAGTNNFMKTDVYGEVRACYLHKEAAQRLELAFQKLQSLAPGYKFLLFDCLRPGSAQKILWAYVKGTPEQKYVADPARGSIHSYGLAIDLSLADEKGIEVDMGTPFDQFDALAEPQHEERFLKEGRLSQAQIKNREILRQAMSHGGFRGLPHEWWHFDAHPPAEVRRKYQIVP